MYGNLFFFPGSRFSWKAVYSYRALVEVSEGSIGGSGGSSEGSRGGDAATLAWARMRLETPVNIVNPGFRVNIVN